MRRFLLLLTAAGSLLLRAPSVAAADPKIEDTTLGDSGKWAGYTLCPHGGHAAVLLNKGSRFAVAVDGTEGPRVDGVVGFDGTAFMPGADASLSRPIPVGFSDDGLHSAYFAKIGDEYLLISDNKEIARGKYAPGAFAFAPLTVTSKHVLFGEPSPKGGYRIVVDGAPGPDSHTPPSPVISPDGAHYAYIGTEADGHDTKWAFVDGKQVKFFGDKLQFTAKGHLTALVTDPTAMGLSIDNKLVMRAGNIQQLWISPTGGEFAALINPQKASPSLLTINTKPVPGSEGALVTHVFFSPDDKHYAALCGSVGQQYIILDGKKGQNYQMINTAASMSNPGLEARAWASQLPSNAQYALDNNPPAFPGFTADSSKFLYVAMSGQKYFLVTNEDESDGMPSLFTPIVSPDGKHVAIITGDGMQGRKASLLVDDKTVKLTGRQGAISGGPVSFTFSPDSGHYVFTSGGVLYIDGVEKADLSCGGKYAYSPDGKHLLLVGIPTANANTTNLYLDGKAIALGDASNIFHPTFTADSKHLFWIRPRQATTTDDHDSGTVAVDGKPTTIQFQALDAVYPGSWQVAPDGSLTLIARTGDELHRYHVTPDAATGVNTMASAAPVK